MEERVRGKGGKETEGLHQGVRVNTEVWLHSHGIVEVGRRTKQAWTVQQEYQTWLRTVNSIQYHHQLPASSILSFSVSKTQKPLTSQLGTPWLET